MIRTSKILCAVGLLLLSLTCIAQEQKQMNSFVILPNGVKVMGEIDGQFDVEAYDEIQFTSHAGEKSVYLPGEIHSFGLENGRFFKSETIPIKDQPVFVQVLVTSSLDLYKWDE